jgi:hypothetical protein
LRSIVTVDPTPVVIILLPPAIVRAPKEGVAVPESVGNEAAVVPEDSRLSVLAPGVNTIVPPVDVNVENAGSAPVAPINNWPLVPTLVESIVPMPSPIKTAFAVIVESPVPPDDTGNGKGPTYAIKFPFYLIDLIGCSIEQYIYR